MRRAPLPGSPGSGPAEGPSPGGGRGWAREDRGGAGGRGSGGADVRGPLVIIVAAALLRGGAAPAAPPDAPVSYIGVEELKLRLDRGEKADIIDVRTWPEYRERHIKGARSIPIRTLSDRAQEIPQSGLVVFY